MPSPWTSSCNKRTTSLVSTTTPWARDCSPSPPPATVHRLGVGRRRGPTVALPQTCGTVPRAVLQPRGQPGRHASDGVVAFATGPATQDVAHAKDARIDSTSPSSRASAKRGDSGAGERHTDRRRDCGQSGLDLGLANCAGDRLGETLPGALLLEKHVQLPCCALLGQRSACANCALVMLERPSTP